MSPTLILWFGFAALILVAMALDLGVFHRKATAKSFRESLTWVLVWFTLAMLFCAGVYNHRGADKALEFLTGYIIEISLSMDNVFVFVMIFTYFAVPPSFQHKILFWGILGALVFRGVMIGLGCALIAKFAWILYVFGAILIYTGIKMACKGADEKLEPERNPVVKLFRRFIPMTDGFRGAHFFVRENGRLLATPMALILLLVETTDIVFAVDSVPAIFAITTDPFIVYTSNVFAILGLRSLYFVLGHAMDKFRFLHYGLGLVLVFVGAKMLAEYFHIEINTLLSLAIVGAVLLTSVILSLLIPPRADKSEGSG